MVANMNESILKFEKIVIIHLATVKFPSKFEDVCAKWPNIPFLGIYALESVHALGKGMTLKIA